MLGASRLAKPIPLKPSTSIPIATLALTPTPTFTCICVVGDIQFIRTGIMVYGSQFPLTYMFLLGATVTDDAS